MIFSAIALFTCGAFFGAAVYISLVQHPAAIDAGVAVGGRFFPPMYNRAAPVQILLAVTGFLSGIAAWFSTDNILWIIGALLLISVVPITLIIIKPINDILLSPDNDPESEETRQLLLRWGPKHWIRSVVSGLSFLVYIYAAVA